MGAEQSKLFFIKTAQVIDEEIENFIAIIVPRQHQYLDDIIARFDAEIAMFQSNKPEWLIRDVWIMGTEPPILVDVMMERNVNNWNNLVQKWELILFS